MKKKTPNGRLDAIIGGIGIVAMVVVLLASTFYIRGAGYEYPFESDKIVEVRDEENS